MTRPQQTRASGEMAAEYIQNIRPVAASRATTWFGGRTVYITPSTTSGVASNFSLASAGARVWKTHCSSRFLTLAGVICVSGL